MTMNFNQLLSHIKNEEPKNLYLFYGPELYLLNGSVRQITKTVVPKDFEQFNLVRFDGRKTTPEEWEMAASEYPFCSDRKCVVINGFDYAALKSGGQKTLSAFIERIPDFAILLLVMNDTEVNLKKDAKLRAFAEKVSGIGIVTEFAHKTAAELARMMSAEAKKRGVVLDVRTAALLVEKAGIGIGRLTTELAKLCAYKMGGEITAEDIQLLTDDKIESTIYDLAKAVVKKDGGRAMQLIDDLYRERVEPVVIISALTSAVVDVYRVKIARRAGLSWQNAAGDFPYKGKDFRLRNASYDLDRFSDSRIKDCMRILFEADRMLKLSKADNRIVIEQAAARMIAA
ncbi:MAG: DNA polymerase III subunit delta [Oscillospiraceae bacterium]|nr:DNA polymerase III subunit delta [Oscillospiraceae bacterium]